MVQALAAAAPSPACQDPDLVDLTLVLLQFWLGRGLDEIMGAQGCGKATIPEPVCIHPRALPPRPIFPHPEMSCSEAGTDTIMRLPRVPAVAVPLLQRQQALGEGQQAVADGLPPAVACAPTRTRVLQLGRIATQALVMVMVPLRLVSAGVGRNRDLAPVPQEPRADPGPCGDRHLPGRGAAGAPASTP